MYRTYKKLLQKTSGVRKERLKRLPKHRPLVTDEFTEVKEGRFYAQDLRELRIKLLSENWPVQASLSSPHDIKTFENPIEKGIFCETKSIPENNFELPQFVENLQLLSHVPLYRNEGMPALMQPMLLTLMAQKRQYDSEKEKRPLLKVQKH